MAVYNYDVVVLGSGPAGEMGPDRLPDQALLVGAPGLVQMDREGERPSGSELGRALEGRQVLEK